MFPGNKNKRTYIEIASLLEWTFVYNDYLRNGHFFSVLLSNNRRSFAIFHLILPTPYSNVFLINAGLCEGGKEKRLSKIT